MLAIVKSRSWIAGRACRQLDRADMDAVADIEAGQVDHDPLRDAVDRAEHLDLVAHDVEHAAAAQPGRLLLVDEDDRHRDVTWAPSPTRRKSTCSGASVTGWYCTSRGNVRCVAPSTLISTMWLKKPGRARHAAPARAARRLISTGSLLSP